jgi:hypothetical protein
MTSETRKSFYSILRGIFGLQELSWIIYLSWNETGRIRYNISSIFFRKVTRSLRKEYGLWGEAESHIGVHVAWGMTQ